MSTTNIIKIVFLCAVLIISNTLKAMTREMTFELFYNEFLRSGSNPPSFDIQAVKNFSTFWVQFQESQCGSPTFRYSKVRDFKSFYKEFTTSNSGSDNFSICYALKNQ
jgi:hypothetical protein